MAAVDAAAQDRAGPRVSQRRLMVHVLIFLGLIGTWEAAARMGLLDPLLFPRPSAILASFYTIYIGTGNVWYHLYITMAEVFVGFVAGSVLGITLGALVGFNDTIRRFLKPYVIVLEATPRIAVAPLLIAALGFGWGSKIAIVMLVCFFAPFINTLSGVVNINEQALELFRSMRATKWQTFRKLVVPDAIPVIMAGERLAMASALSGALVAEFISANEGMGLLISRYTGSLNMASAFAALFTLTAVGFVIFRAMERLDTALVFWAHPDATERVSRRRARAWAQRTRSPSA